MLYISHKLKSKFEERLIDPHPYFLINTAVFSPLFPNCQVNMIAFPVLNRRVILCMSIFNILGKTHYKTENEREC